jgi:hypothetical protein
MRDANGYDTAVLLTEWRWLVPANHTPLFVSAFGDWVLGAPDGSIWVMSTLDGDCRQVARDATQYNMLSKSTEWTEETFLSEWFPIAIENGLVPSNDECLGWKLHPVVGGTFAVDNLQLFTMRVYLSLTGQLHRQIRRPK